MQIVNIGVVPDIHFASLHIVIDRHIVEKYGFHADIKEFSGGTAELAKALASGTVNAGIGLTEGIYNIYF